MAAYFAEEAIKAIEVNRNRPFFMYLAFNAPHTPLQATRADYDKLAQIKDHKTRVYGAMIAQMDRPDNTLVIFTSDNGGAWYNGIEDLNAPFRGWKATFFEGGIRTPMFMRWPGGIAPGTQRADLTGHLDIFSTIAGAAARPGNRQREYPRWSGKPISDVLALGRLPRGARRRLEAAGDKAARKSAPL